MYASWIIALIAYFTLGKANILITPRLVWFILLIFVVYMVWIFSCTVSSITPVWNSTLKNILLSFFLYLSGYLLITDYVSRDKLITVYLFCSLLLSLYILNKYAVSYSQWYNSEIYLVAHKNQYGMILSAATILSFWGLPRASRRINFFITIVGVICSVTILYIQCRTALLALIIILLYHLKITNSKLLKYLIPFFLYLC